MDKSPLAKLPAELRNKIYELALVERFSERDFVVVCNRWPRWQVPGLLQTCQQLRREAASAYWSDKEFGFMARWMKDAEEAGFYRMVKWLAAIGETQRGLLRTIIYDDEYPPPEKVKVEKAIQQCRAELSAYGVGIDGAQIWMKTNDVSVGSEELIFSPWGRWISG